MKIFRNLFASILMIFAIQSAVAQSFKPAYCPPPIAIKFATITHVIDLDPGWAIGIESIFGTANKWSFILYGILAKDKNEAAVKGKLLLQTLKFYTGPVDGPISNAWTCFYFALGHPGLAFNSENNINLNLIKGALK